MLSKNLQEILCRTINFAVNQLNHLYLLPEHLLFCLLDEDPIVAFLNSASVNIHTLKNDIYSYLIYDLEDLRRKEFFSSIRPSNSLKFTQSFISILERAITHASYSGRVNLEAQDILLEILLDYDSHSDYLLNRQNVDATNMIRFFSEKKRAASNEKTKEKEKQKAATSVFLSEKGYDFLANFGTLAKGKKPTTIIDQYCINLNEKAEKSKVDNLIGREREIGFLIKALCCRRKNNVILVGESGVGKTAIVEHLAKKIVNKDNDIPIQLQDSVVYSLDISALMSGTRYRGDLEERLRSLIAEIEASEFPVKLFIDEIHNIVGTGSTNHGTLDIGNIMKPHLARGNISCIGATTIKEFNQFLSKDKALIRRFQRVDVAEPSNEDSQLMIEGVIDQYSKHHKVSYLKSAISEAIFLSKRYFNERHLPDSALDVLDFAGATKNAETAQDKGPRKITKKEIQETVALLTDIPSEQLSASQAKIMRNLEKTLHKMVLGQNESIQKICNSIIVHKSGLNDRKNTRPIASFLFYGPTGVGKTELANQISIALGMKLLRFDMSEYSETHAVSKLTGAPPGYVGFEQSGQLAEQVLRNPYSVIIFDEIEKAHTSIHNSLLQVLDYGTLTDNFGRKVKFTDTIIIFTTNVAAKSMERNSLGFESKNDGSHSEREVNEFFSPEFRNRLTAVLKFNHLGSNTIREILKTEIESLTQLLKKKNFELIVEEGAFSYLIKHGYDMKMGARNIKRVFDRTVKPQIAEIILAKSSLNPGGRIIKINAEEDKLLTSLE